MTSREPEYVVDPDDPRAPPTDVWKRMTPEQQLRVLEALPSEFEPSEASPPEGDAHTDAVFQARDVLRGFFERSGRRVYVGNDLPVYYPAERMFAPDVIAVVDVEPHSRERWSVDAERKGLDLAIEILVAGSRAKYLRDNVVKYARLGIGEYFIFDVKRQRLQGHRLASAQERTYTPILPQHGAYACAALGLELTVQAGRLHFLVSGAALPETRELFERASAQIAEAVARAEAAEQAAFQVEAANARAEEEARLRQTVTHERDEARAKLEAALAEIERLRRGG